MLYDRYIMPYGGMMYLNWDTPEDIEAEHLIRFYTQNGLPSLLATKDEGYLSQLPDYKMPVPADVVESFIAARFQVKPEQLHTAPSYQTDSESYLIPISGGFGGGPMTVERAEKSEDGTVLTIFCKDAEDTELSVAVKIVDDDHFYYINGN